VHKLLDHASAPGHSCETSESRTARQAGAEYGVITMADDATVDLSTFPDIDVSTELTAGQEDQQDSSIQMISFPFCLLFAGRPWVTITVAAPSPELAATTVDQYVRQVANPTLMRMEYPQNICSWSSGGCS